jgi:hypothetical protein
MNTIKRKKNNLGSEGKKESPAIILYPAKPSFRNKREVKPFHDKQKLKEFINIRTTLHEMLTGVLHEKKMITTTMRTQMYKTQQ